MERLRRLAREALPKTCRADSAPFSVFGGGVASATGHRTLCLVLHRAIEIEQVASRKAL